MIYLVKNTLIAVIFATLMMNQSAWASSHTDHMSMTKHDQLSYPHCLENNQDEYFHDTEASPDSHCHGVTCYCISPKMIVIIDNNGDSSSTEYSQQYLSIALPKELKPPIFMHA